MSSKGGLGRGLTSLIPPGPPKEDSGGAGGGLLEVPTGSVQPNPNQPRRHFDEEGIDELAASMRELGVLQPLLVRLPDDGDDGYVLIAGERRLRAARRAGLERVPVVVRDTGGAGLGLAIAHEIARWHGGAIEAQSQVGAGAEFTVRLPTQLAK